MAKDIEAKTWQLPAVDGVSLSKPLPDLPAQVTGLSVTGKTSSSISLSWSAASGADTYNLYRGETLVQSGIADTSAISAGLSASTQYTHTVAGVNATGEGPESSGVTDTTSAESSSGDYTAAGVTGDFTEGGNIAISYDGTNGFGAGNAETVFLLDGRDGVADQVVQSSDLLFANTVERLRAVRYRTTHSHSRGFSMNTVYDGNDYSIVTTYPDTQHLCLSYHMFFPLGTNVPGAATESYPTSNSHAKYTWISRNWGTTDKDELIDLCVPSNYSAANIRVGGNEGSKMVQSVKKTYVEAAHTYGEWWWVSASITPTAVRERYMSASKGMKAFNTVTDVYGDYPNQHFNHFHLSPWYSSRSGVNLFKDDINLMSGEGSPGVVIIGNASTLMACTELQVQRPLTRSNTGVEVVVDHGPFATLDGKYLFVCDLDRNPVPYSGAEGRLISEAT